MRGESWQHPALQTAPDDSRAHDAFPPLLPSRNVREMNAAEFIASLEPTQ
jgi:hypothetical protein